MNYIVEASSQSDYSVGQAILVRVDSRGTGSRTVHTYAPITVGGCADHSMAFEDLWNEVITLKEYRRDRLFTGLCSLVDGAAEEK